MYKQVISHNIFKKMINNGPKRIVYGEVTNIILGKRHRLGKQSKSYEFE